MIVCHCHGRNDRKVTRVANRLVRGGEHDAEAIVEAIGVETGAGTNCGSCIPTIESIVNVSLRNVLAARADDGLDDAVGM